MAFAALTIDLNAKLAKFEQDMARSGRSLDGLNSKVRGLESGFKTAFGALAGLAGAGALTSLVKSSIDAADALNDLSLRTRVSVKDLASLKLAAEQNGTTLDNVGTAIQKLNLSFSQGQGGNKEMVESLQRLGINSADARERLFQLADAYAKNKDDTRVLADLQKVLGKSYGELVPLLAQGGTELRKSTAASETFADAMARLAPNADKFNDQLAQLKLNAAGAAGQLANALLPSINNLSAEFAEGIKQAGGFFEAIRLFGFGLNPFKDTGENLESLGKRFVVIEQQLARARENNATGTLKNLQEEREDVLKQIKYLTAIQNLGKPAAAAGTPSAKSNIIDFKLPSSSKTSKPEKLDSIISPLLKQQMEEADKLAKRLAEDQAELNEHFQKTNEILFEQNRAWSEAGRALEEEMRTPLENFNTEMGRLNELLDRGNISWETYTRAVFKAQDGLDGVNEKLDEMDTFAKKAAENIQDAFADFLFDPFADGLNGMLKGFGQMIQRMIAEAVAADLARYLFGDLVKGGSGTGAIGDVFSAVLGAFGGGKAEGGPLQPGKWYVAGERGPEPIWGGGAGAFAAGYQGGGMSPTIVVNVGNASAPDARRAAAQGAREGLAAFERARRYG